MPSPSLEPKANWLYDLILALFVPTLDLFFREIQVRGAWRIPNHGAVILVAAPHANQFVDSLVLMRIMRALNRRVSFIMAAKSFERPFIGTMATAISAVPVARAMDITQPGEGTIYLPDPESDPRLLRGIGTKFDGPLFKPGSSIYLPSVNGESTKLDILEVRSPDEILLKYPPSSQDAVRQLTKQTMPDEVGETVVGSKFKVAPHVDQSQVYNAVYERLRNDGCIGIFPEGGSHDRPAMLPLKAGIAIMALGAKAENTDLTVIPVGMNYFHAHKFRSRAVIEIGDPIDIPPELVADFRSGKRRDSVGTVLGSVYSALGAVTTTAPDYESLMLVYATRRLYLSTMSKTDLKSIVEINRRILKGYTQYSNDPQIQSLKTEVSQYTQNLRLLSLRDHQVEYVSFSTFRIFSSLLYRAALLLILTIGTLPGLLLFSPVFIIARTISHKKIKEALAASSVKIRGNDVMASWKIMVAALLAPCLYTFYIILIVYWKRYNNINGLISSTTSVLYLIFWSFALSIAMTFAALRLGEVGMDILKSLRPLLLCLSPSAASTLAQLRVQRGELVRKVTDVVNTLGPELFPDCEARRLPQPRRLYGDVSPFDSLDDLVGSEFFSD